jgi:hypothetical protein
MADSGETGGQLISGELTLEVLRKINVWWETGVIPQEFVPQTKRFMFKDVLDFLDDRRIIGIVGPRRTGKTTLMYQLMQFLINEKKVKPRHILFFSGDDVELKQANDLIGTAIKVYFEDYLKQDYHGKEKMYVFIDEIHKIKNWQLWLKKYYDLRYNIKFIISGSSAAKIKKEQMESLAGRILEFILYPMNFREFLVFNKVDSGLPVIKLDKLDAEVFSKLKETGPLKTLELKKLFDEYLLAGGFPEWFETKNIVKWQMKIIDDIVKRVIYDDVATLYNIKNPARVESLFFLLCALQSRAYSYNSMATTLKIDNETAEAYVGYLKESFLLFELQNYASSVEKQVRKNYKYVIVDSGVGNAFEKITDLSGLDENLLGYIVESSVQRILCQKSKKEIFRVFYWKDHVEVDAVIDIGGILVPVEVKYRSSARDIEGLRKFMEKYNIKRGIVASKDELKMSKAEGKEIYFIPCWMLMAVLD